MALTSRPYSNRYVPSSQFPAGTKWLLIVTSSLSLLYLILRKLEASAVFEYFFLIPQRVVHGFAIWQVGTYIFLHGDIWNLIWNMLALWMFGAELERTWGRTRFIRFYLLCGVIGGITVVLASLFFGGMNGVTLGASSAILGLLVAYGVVFPDRSILFGFLIPMKSKYFVMIIAGVVIFQSFTTVASRRPASVAVLADIGGLAAGFFLLRGKRLYAQTNLFAVDSYKDWKLRRAKKKFAVYLKKSDSRRDRTLH